MCPTRSSNSTRRASPGKTPTGWPARSFHGSSTRRPGRNGRCAAWSSATGSCSASVATALRRAELIALDWGDLELDGPRPSPLVRRGKGERPRRQPLTAQLVGHAPAAAPALHPRPSDPVICGLGGKRLTVSILCTSSAAPPAASLDGKPVTAHTLRHTAATWLRAATGDARLVAAYLGHADLSTVSRYAHVADDELHEAAAAIARNGGLERGLSRPTARAIVDAAMRRVAGTARLGGTAGRPRRVIP